ncbi:MarR family transcriptional regulator [Xanthobacter sp. V3C-3]|uniref:MarR family winged helix-turn-helix transcriptional regulator n=1 Tax=Xanthobacter lutulentifluminis TaxID=3119935 RepID=UPI00372C57C1
MSLSDLYEKPGHLIRRAHQISWALFLDECAEFNITPVQYAAMVAIEERPGVDATRLSSLIAFDRSTIGNVIERLEARGLVVRKPSSEDKRVKLLFLSSEGSALLRNAEASVERVQERMLAPLSPAERKQFMKLLTRLATLNNEATSAPIRTVEETEGAERQARSPAR